MQDHNLSNDSPERANRLREKIDQVEKAVKEQVSENSRILQMIKEHDTRLNNDNNNLNLNSNESRRQSSVTEDYLKSRIAVLVFSCNRPSAVRNHLDQLLK